MLSIHGTLHGITGVEEFELDKTEAKQLAEAMSAVAEEYDFKPSPKSMAVTNMITTMALVYGTRAFAFRARKATEKAEKKMRGADNVVTMRPGA